MNGDSTINDLICYMYHETEGTETEAIRRKLALDAEWRSEYRDLQAVKNMLDSLICNPSDTSVNIILNHSKKLGTLETV